MIAVFSAADGTFSYDNGRTFDTMKLDDLDDAGIALGKRLSAGLLCMSCTTLIALLVLRPRSRLRP